MTPGPWMWVKSCGDYLALVSSPETDSRGNVSFDAEVVSACCSVSDESTIFAKSSDAALIAKVPEMVELLRELEWGGPGNGGMPYCVLCGCLDHAPDCRLHEILKLAEEPRGEI